MKQNHMKKGNPLIWFKKKRKKEKTSCMNREILRKIREQEITVLNILWSRESFMVYQYSGECRVLLN